MTKDGLSDKIADQLKQAYDSTLKEPIPDEIMRLVAKLETITRGQVR